MALPPIQTDSNPFVFIGEEAAGVEENLIQYKRLCV